MGESEGGAHAPAGTHPGGKSRPSTPPRAQVSDNERQLRRLGAFLEDAVGFQLALVTCDTPRVRDQQLDRLAQQLRASRVWLTRVDLTETPQERQLLERLRRHLAGLEVPRGKRPALMVVGLEATLDYHRLGPDAAEGLAILENANAQRDAFARDCPVAVAIWLNPTATSVLAARAADLWHWRSGTFRFAGAAESRREMEDRLLEMPVVESFSLPRKEALERIAALRDLLAESRASPQADTLRGRQRRMALLTELGLAYFAIADFERAIGVWEEGLRIAIAIGDRWAEADALVNLGLAYGAQGDLTRAIDDYDHALELYRTLVESEARRELRNDLARVYNNRGLAYRAQGDLAQVIDDYDHALELYRTLVESEGRRELRNDLATVYNNRGNAYRAQGDPARAIEDYDHALELRRTLVESEGRRELVGDLAGTLYNRGLAHTAMGAWDEARADLDTGGGLLHEAVRAGRTDLLPSLMQTVTGRIRALDRLGHPEVVGPWLSDLTERLETLAPQYAGNPLWQERAARLAEAVSDNKEPLEHAGVETDRLLRALAPLLEPPPDTHGRV